MPDESEKSRSLLQLAISLRLAAQRLAESASRMQQAATHQRQYLERLNLLRDRIVELLTMCQHLTGKDAPAAAPDHPAREAAASQPAPAPSAPSAAAQAPKSRLPASAFVEFSNWQEFEKFRHMAPISDKELDSCDVEELIRRLNEGVGGGQSRP